MSQSITDTLRQLHETGYTLTDLLEAVDAQLDLIRKSDALKATEDKARLLSLARTNIETGLLYAEKFESETGLEVPLIHEED